MRFLNAARAWIEVPIRLAASACRRMFGKLSGSDVRSLEDLQRFWAERRSRGLGPERVSSEDGNAALHRTMNINTKDAYRGLNVSNYKVNSPRLKTARGIQELDAKYRRGTVFIVAAGPSLDKNIDELKRINGRWPIFACDAVLPMLAAHGIEPDYAMLVDVKDTQARFFADIKPGTKTKLLAVACAHRKALEAWPGEVLFFNSQANRRDQRLQLKVGQDFGSIGVGGNVSTALLCLVTNFCEATTVVFVGHDFSFQPGKYYAKNGLHDMAAAMSAKPWWDINGETVYTNFQLWAYRNWTVDFADSLYALDEKLEANGINPMGYRLINATEGGILGTTKEFRVNSDLFEYAKLSETIDNLEAASVGSGVGAPPPKSETGDAMLRRALARA